MLHTWWWTEKSIVFKTWIWTVEYFQMNLYVELKCRSIVPLLTYLSSSWFWISRRNGYLRLTLPNSGLVKESEIFLLAADFDGKCSPDSSRSCWWKPTSRESSSKLSSWSPAPSSPSLTSAATRSATMLMTWRWRFVCSLTSMTSRVFSSSAVPILMTSIVFWASAEAILMTSIVVWASFDEASSLEFFETSSASFDSVVSWATFSTSWAFFA